MPFDDVTLTCKVLLVSEEYYDISYTWCRIDGDIPAKSNGRSSHKLTIPRFALADEGQYYCMPETFEHCAESNTVTLTLDGEKIQH